MKKYLLLLICFVVITSIESFCQDKYIRSKEGRAVMLRDRTISNCLKTLHKDRTDKTALDICECEVNKLDGHFTMKQYKKYTTDDIIDLTGLLKEDSVISKEIKECYTNSGQMTLLSAEGFESEFIASCVKYIRNNTEKTLDTNKVERFCKCQLELIKEKKITDAQMKTINNPNSILFYEMMYKCENPFSVKESNLLNWNKNLIADINGPDIDTISVLNLDGMTYLKVKIGNLVQVWLFDTGASDLLVDKETEEQLKKEGVISEANYLGTSEYEMANGTIDTCRKYKINKVQIGAYTINNINVAVTDKGKRVIIGRTLLNKFTKWILNNENSTLILHK